MANKPITVTAEQAAIIKVAAAAWYKEHGIRPVTADYIYNRYLHKQAVKAGIIPKPSTVARDRAIKLATSLKPIIAKVKAAKV